MKFICYWPNSYLDCDYLWWNLVPIKLFNNLTAISEYDSFADSSENLENISSQSREAHEIRFNMY